MLEIEKFTGVQLNSKENLYLALEGLIAHETLGISVDKVPTIEKLWTEIANSFPEHGENILKLKRDIRKGMEVCDNESSFMKILLESQNYFGLRAEYSVLLDELITVPKLDDAGAEILMYLMWGRTKNNGKDQIEDETVNEIKNSLSKINPDWNQIDISDLVKALVLGNL